MDSAIDLTNPPLGLFFSQKRALSCGKGLRIAKSLPFKSAPKPALGHLLNLLFNGDLNLNGLCHRFDEPPSGALLLPEEESVLWERS